MTDSVVVVENVTPVVQVTYPAAGVVEVTRNEFSVEIQDDCEIVVVGDAANVVEIGSADQVETTEVNVVVEVADTDIEVVSIGEQGQTGATGPQGPVGPEFDDVKYQEIIDMAITGAGPAEVTTIYKGEAVPGSLRSAAVWRISRKVVLTGVDEVDPVTTWADGTAAFVKVWDSGSMEYLGYDYDPNT